MRYSPLRSYSSSSSPSPHKLLFEGSNTLVVRSGAALVHFKLEPSCVQGRRTINLVDHAEPNSSFYPLPEGCQHTFRPYQMFHPVPFVGSSFFHLPSRFRHSHRLYFMGRGHHASTFLRPSTLRSFHRFQAAGDALPPARPTLRSHAKGNEQQRFTRQVSLVHATRPSMHSVTRCLQLPEVGVSRERTSTSQIAPASRPTKSGFHTRHH